jgi:hypothetical protein
MSRLVDKIKGMASQVRHNNAKNKKTYIIASEFRHEIFNF